MSSDPIDPIEAVGGLKKAAPKAPIMHAIGTDTKDQDFSGTNYILLVMKYTNIAMEHQSQIVALRGELANVVTKMQGDMATISEFISKIQQESHSGSIWGSQPYGGSDCHKFWTTDANGMNGLNTDFYKVVEGGDPSLIGRDDPASGTTIDPSYQNAMKGFIAAVKDLFYSSGTSGTGPTVQSLTKITNPYDASGKTDFDMTSYWHTLHDSYGDKGKGYDMQGKTVIATDPKAHASLLQQYMFYQAQLTVNTSSKTDIMSAAGDITKLVNFDPMSPENNLDSNIQPMLSMLDSLNTTVTVGRNCSQGPDRYNTADAKQSRNILSMILTGDNGDLYTSRVAGASYCDGTTQTGADFQASGYTGNQVGLYGAFSYAAFDYVWTKNPNTSNSTQVGNPGGINGRNLYKNDADVGAGNPGGDPLSTMYASTNTVQTNFSNAASQTNQNFQLDVNSVQQIDGAAGKMVDGYSQSQSTSIHNFKSA